MFIRKADISTVAIWAIFIMLFACVGAQADQTHQAQTEAVVSDMQNKNTTLNSGSKTAAEANARIQVAREIDRQRAEEARARLNQTATITSERYEKQGIFKCNGENLNIPSYFPFTENNESDGHLDDQLYIIGGAHCSSDNYKVILSFGKDCQGQSICLRGSFSSSKIVNSTVTAELLDMLLLQYQGVILDHHTEAFFVPARCQNYCTQSYLVWSDSGRYYAIGTTGGGDKTLAELTKAANSYLNHKEQQ